MINTKKQKLLIELLVSSTDTFALCQNIIKPIYFDPELRSTVSFIKEYYSSYSTTPSTAQIEAETNVKLEERVIYPDEVQYCANELEKFCKNAAMKQAILKAVDLLEKEDYGKIESEVKEALLTSLTKNLGLRYFETVEERLNRMLHDSPTHSTGWADIDDALFGGISKKELLLVSANSGGGKSVTLANLAYNFVANGLNVLYVSLELSEDTIGQRFDTMYSGISRRVWRDHVPEIVTKVSNKLDKSGILDIIQMPTQTTSNDIRAFLQEYYLHYNHTPDLLIIDYIDIMGPNEKVSADNVYEKDKRCSEQIRQIGVDLNMCVATASQLNRSAVGATDHNHSQIAGGISKIDVCDVYWSIIMTEEMRNMGKIIFILQKTRNSDGVGKQVHLKWCNKTLRITDGDNYSSSSSKISFNIATDTPDPINILDENANGNKLTGLLNSIKS